MYLYSEVMSDRMEERLDDPFPFLNQVKIMSYYGDPHSLDWGSLAMAVDHNACLVIENEKH